MFCIHQIHLPYISLSHRWCFGTSENSYSWQIFFFKLEESSGSCGTHEVSECYHLRSSRRWESKERGAAKNYRWGTGNLMLCFTHQKRTCQWHAIGIHILPFAIGVLSTLTTFIYLFICHAPWADIWIFTCMALLQDLVQIWQPTVALSSCLDRQHMHFPTK